MGEAESTICGSSTKVSAWGGLRGRAHTRLTNFSGISSGLHADEFQEQIFLSEQDEARPDVCEGLAKHGEFGVRWQQAQSGVVGTEDVTDAVCPNSDSNSNPDPDPNSNADPNPDLNCNSDPNPNL